MISILIDERGADNPVAENRHVWIAAQIPMVSVLYKIFIMLIQNCNVWEAVKSMWLYLRDAIALKIAVRKYEGQLVLCYF